MDMISPEEVGFSSKRLERLEGMAQGYVDAGKLAGVVTMLSRGGKTFHFEKFGLADTNQGRPMELDTLFRIYSMTKPITSAAVMMLYEEGNFHLDDPVSKFIPELDGLQVYAGMWQSGPRFEPQQRPITIRQLLTHTAGLSYGFLEDFYVDAMYREADPNNPDGTLKDAAKKLGELPLAYQPGAGWRYSVATDMLGYLVEVISGQPFAEFLDEMIFQPLGMSDTAFYVSEDRLDRFAAVYGSNGNGGIRELDDDRTKARFQQPVTLPSGGGGLVSTATDYMTFCTMILNGGELNGVRLLGRKTVEMMTRNHLTEEQRISAMQTMGEESMRGCGFGLGFRVVLDAARSGYLGSEGMYSWGGAASTAFWIDPKEELIAILMTQFMPSSYYPIRRDFQVAVYQAMTG